MSGSVSRSKNDPSQSLQMIERPLMTADELKSMDKGNFIVMKTGTHPFISKLKLFFKWGIKFDTEPYVPKDKGSRTVKYTSRKIIEKAINELYPSERKINDREEKFPENKPFSTSGQALTEYEVEEIPEDVMQEQSEYMSEQKAQHTVLRTDKGDINNG